MDIKALSIEVDDQNFVTHHHRSKMATTNAEAKDYLNGLLNKSLRVTTTDKRMFLGEFKCTDSVAISPSSLQHVSKHPATNIDDIGS